MARALEKLEKESTPGNWGFLRTETMCFFSCTPQLSPQSVISRCFFVKVLSAPASELSHSCVNHSDLIKSWRIFHEVKDGYSSFPQHLLRLLTVHSTNDVKSSWVSVLMLLRSFFLFPGNCFSSCSVGTCYIQQMYSVEIYRVMRQ